MLKKKSAYVVAVAGATGAVGREMIEILEERNYPVAELVLLASDRSEGERISYKGRGVPVRILTKDAFAGVDIALFAAGAQRSIDFAPAAVQAGAVVIDISSAFRKENSVPLVVPEVNPQDSAEHAGIIACPGSATIGMVIALKPLHDTARIRRIVVTMLQPVSDSGKKAMDELAGQTVALMNFKELEKGVFPHQIAFNCIPQVGDFREDGATEAEENVAAEMRKVLSDGTLRVTATAVQVPVFRGHCAAINIEIEKALEPNEARALLADIPGMIVYDDPGRILYPLPVDASGKDEIFVGRIRRDETVTHGLNLWIVSDNLRKGAALNAVQIAELLIR